MNRILSVTIMTLLLLAFLPYQANPVYAQGSQIGEGGGLNITITATLYSDGYVRVNASIPAPNGYSSTFFQVLENYTFYKDRTVKDEFFVRNETQMPSASNNEYLEVTLTGFRKQGSLVGLMNLTQVSQRMGKSYTNILMKYKVDYRQRDWALKAHFEIQSNNTLLDNELMNITPQEFFSIQGAEIDSFNHTVSNGKNIVDLTAIVPYQPTTSYTSYMSGYMSMISLISQNRTLEINNYAYIWPSGVKMKQHVIYKGGFTEHLKSFIDEVKQSYQRQQGMTGNETMSTSEKAMINAFEELADNFEVKDGTSYTQLITMNANIITTPLVREKGVENPVKTLIGLRNVLLTLSKSDKAGFNATQVLNQKIIIKPGDPGIKKIQPNQTILGNLENVKVNPETPSNNKIIIGGIATVLAVIAIIAVYIIRKPGSP